MARPAYFCGFTPLRAHARSRGTVEHAACAGDDADWIAYGDLAADAAGAGEEGARNRHCWCELRRAGMGVELFFPDQQEAVDELICVVRGGIELAAAGALDLDVR